MSSLNLGKISLIMIVLSLLSHNDVVFVGGDSTFISSYCDPTSGNYSRSGGDNFAANMGDAVTSMLKDAQGGAFFSDVSVGSDVDQVFGMYYCDGGIDPSDCNACVVEAIWQIQESCNTKEAVVWYLECTLRYANRYIYSEVDLSPNVHVSLNQACGTPDMAITLDVVATTVTAAMKEAAYNTMSNPPGYAAAQTNITPTASLVAVAQCSPDIVGPGCSYCLMEAATNITASNGGLILLPSCYLRYAIHSLRTPQLY